MREFRVRWEIDVSAQNHIAAAREAHQIQLDPLSTASVFHVSPAGTKLKGDTSSVVRLARRIPGVPVDLGEIGHRSSVKVWITGLVPTVGAETYNGIRLAAAFTERDAYLDLASFLDEDYSEATNEEIAEALNDSDQIQAWTIEEQSVGVGQ